MEIKYFLKIGRLLMILSFFMSLKSCDGVYENQKELAIGEYLKEINVSDSYKYVFFIPKITCDGCSKKLYSYLEAEKSYKDKSLIIQGRELGCVQKPKSLEDYRCIEETLVSRQYFFSSGLPFKVDLNEGKVVNVTFFK